LDQFFARPKSPGRAINEGHISPTARDEYNPDWISQIEDEPTRDYILSYNIARTDIVNGVATHTPARCPSFMRYDCGAPIDVHGFPMTHHFDENTDEYIPHGRNPAFIRIDKTTSPLDCYPTSFILQRWQTGPDILYTASNPLYQFARHNIEFPEDDLPSNPEILYYNREFIFEYNLDINIFATLFRHTPHRKTACFNHNKTYSRDPPNINGQFVVLHHNCYPAAYVDDIYPVDPNNPADVRERFNATPNPLWDSMEEIDRMRSIDKSFIQCTNHEERVALWTSIIPNLLMYQFVFCSVCCCRLPDFYFSTQQRHCTISDTQRACRHCDHNRSLKFLQVGRIFDALIGTRLCLLCSTEYDYHHYHENIWNNPKANPCICLTCADHPDSLDFVEVFKRNLRS
jgi:hypothetical protein